MNSRPDQRQSDRRQEAERDAPGRLARLAADVALEPLGIGEQRLDLRKQARAGLRQLDAATGAVEQPRAALALQRVELPAQQ